MRQRRPFETEARDEPKIRSILAYLPREARRPGSDDIQMLDARGNVAILRFLGVQLDMQAQVVDRVGVSQRILVADLAQLEQVEQSLVEGLHAELAGLLHDLLDLVHLTLEYQVRDERRVQHDLDGGAAALALLQGGQALRDHSAPD